jgi:transcriptional regulator with XRE-family HTH domain
LKLHKIGLEIRKLRKDKNFTQNELAKKCGISRITLGKLERGSVVSISIRTLDLILYSLGYEINFKNKQGFGLPTLDELNENQNDLF